jgi:hypothetical protein
LKCSDGHDRQRLKRPKALRPNAQVNRQKCGAFLSALNLQLGWCAQAE